MKWPQEFTPKIAILKSEGYSRSQFTQDVLSGLIVGVVALPLAIAFAIASGSFHDNASLNLTLPILTNEA